MPLYHTAPMSNQSIAPLLECLQTLAHRSRAAFHTPGHKQGQGSPQALVELLGDRSLRADLPELPELDNLFAPEGVIEQAQDLAAQAFGAEKTWFLANGSTCGIEAAILATCQPGDQLILPRNAHQSAIAALILAGVMPIWVEPTYDPDWQLTGLPSLESLETALQHHPDARAVLIVSPTYHGICGPISAIANLVHQFGLPLLVDEAHGAHLAFHPDLPACAMASGADLAVQSIHKTLSALTQAAMLHVQGDRIDRDRVSKSLQLVQSTSPNYLLLASLDAARQQMATRGFKLMQHTLELSQQATTQLSQIPGLKVLTADRMRSLGDGVNLDPTRLTVDVTGLGLTGFEADEILHQTLNVTAELPSLRQLTFIITPGNTPADVEVLVQAFQKLAAEAIDPPTLIKTMPPFPANSMIPGLSPRSAFFAKTIALPVAEAIGRLSGELICPYPPGIPVLLPGEAITTDAICYLQQVLANGGILTGCADSSLETVNVIASSD